MLRVRCVLCVSAGPRCSAILLRVLCGWGAALAAARWWRCLCAVLPPSASAPSHFGPDVSHCAALRAGFAAVLLLVLLWHC